MQASHQFCLLEDLDLKLVKIVHANRHFAVRPLLGVYFTIDQSLSAGTELELTMILPAKITGGTQVFIRGIGKVIRVGPPESKGDQSVAVAAVLERYEITRNEPAVA